MTASTDLKPLRHATAAPSRWGVYALMFFALGVGVCALCCVGSANAQERSAHVRADTLTRDDKGIHLRGQVELVLRTSPNQSWTVRAASLDLDANTLAMRDVVVSSPDTNLRIHARELTLTQSAEGRGELRLQGLAWVVRNPQDDQSANVIRARRAVLRDAQLTLQNATVVPCVSCEPNTLPDPATSEVFALSIESATVQLRASLEAFLKSPTPLVDAQTHIDTQSITFQAYTLPIAYLPSLRVPLDGRSSGLLPPELGWSQRDGLYTSLSAFWAPTPRLDLTPKVWLRSAGLYGSQLSGRFADQDALGNTHITRLDASGWLDRRDIATRSRGGSLRLQGALSPNNLPDVRANVDVSTVSPRTVLQGHPAPLLRRLHTPVPNAVSIGDSGALSSFALRSSLLQTLALAPDVPTQASARRNLWVHEAGYSVRAIPQSPLVLDLDLNALHIQPTPIPTSSVVQPSAAFVDLGSTTRLKIATRARAPIVSGPYGALSAHAGLDQTNDIFTTPDTTSPTNARSKITQSVASWASLAYTATLAGKLGGISHSIRPTIIGYAAALRLRRRFPEQDEDTAADQTATLPPQASAENVYGQQLPQWAIHALLRQRFGSKTSPHLDLDLGMLALRSFEETPDQLRHLSRLGILTRLTLPPTTRLELSLTPQFGAETSIIESNFNLEHTRGEFITALGVTHIAKGPRATLRPWQFTITELPGLFMRRTPHTLTGLTHTIQTPLPWLPWSFEANTIVPVYGEFADPKDTEIALSLRFAEIARCLELRGTWSRTVAPRDTQTFLSLTWEP